jgi:hypothetical protein
MYHYFAADGSYGDAQDAVVVDTSDWGEYEWEAVEEAGDMSRMHVVGKILEQRGSSWGNVASLF